MNKHGGRQVEGNCPKENSLLMKSTRWLPKLEGQDIKRTHVLTSC